MLSGWWHSQSSSHCVRYPGAFVAANLAIIPRSRVLGFGRTIDLRLPKVQIGMFCARSQFGLARRRSLALSGGHLVGYLTLGDTE